MKITLSCVAGLLLANAALAESPLPPPASDADPAWWKQQGEIALRKARGWSPGGPERARNVILFVGDGMGVATVTAARILEGQLRGALLLRPGVHAGRPPGADLIALDGGRDPRLVALRALILPLPLGDDGVPLLPGAPDR